MKCSASPSNAPTLITPWTECTAKGVGSGTCALGPERFLEAVADEVDTATLLALVEVGCTVVHHACTIQQQQQVQKRNGLPHRHGLVHYYTANTARTCGIGRLQDLIKVEDLGRACMPIT
eukprot:COSAG01_NODE_28457_length_660_cov_2.481283_1_plen_119_part_01